MSFGFIFNPTKKHLVLGAFLWEYLFMQNIVEIQVKRRKQIDPNDVFHSIFIAIENRDVPTKSQIISAIKNQIDFYESKGIDSELMEDEKTLLKVFSEVVGTKPTLETRNVSNRLWFSPFDSSNSTMFLSDDYIIVALLHIVWHENKVLDSVTGQVFEGIN